MYLAWVPAITHQAMHCCCRPVAPCPVSNGSNDLSSHCNKQSACVPELRPGQLLNPERPALCTSPSTWIPRSMADLRVSICIYPSICSPSFRAHTLLARSCCNQLNLICSRGRIFRPMNHPVAECLRPGMGAWIAFTCRPASTTTTTIAFGVNVGVGSVLAHCYPVSCWDSRS